MTNPGGLPAPYRPHPPAISISVQQRSQGTAVALEVGLGLIGVFGVGNMYAGKTARAVEEHNRAVWRAGGYQ
jgi:hypothetical protein